MKEFIYKLDVDVLHFVNHTLSNEVFDVVFPFFRYKFTWIPLYIFVLFLIVKKYRKQALAVIGFTILTVFLSDQLSSSVIKPIFERLRPCNNPDFANWLKLPIGKGSGWSFVSSHASNHFALAFIFSYFLTGFKNKIYIPVLFMIWAALVAFAQVYIGFHYPSDVICGAITGLAIAFFTSKTFEYFVKYRDKKSS